MQINLPQTYTPQQVATFFLLNSALKTKSQAKIDLFCSNYSQQENLRVCQRMKLNEQKLKQLFEKKLKQT